MTEAIEVMTLEGNYFNAVRDLETGAVTSWKPGRLGDVNVPYHNPLGVIPDVLDCPVGHVREYGTGTPNAPDAQPGLVACWDPAKAEFLEELPVPSSSVPVAPVEYLDPDDPMDPEGKPAEAEAEQPEEKDDTDPDSEDESKPAPAKKKKTRKKKQ